METQQAWTYLARGRGAGALWALEAPASQSHSAIVELVTHDPCVNSQEESRSEYYAYVVDRAGVEIGALEEFLRAAEPDSRQHPRTGLCVNTLGVLAHRGSNQAAEILSRYVSYTSDVGHALFTLAEAGRLDLVEACRSLVVARLEGDKFELANATGMLPDAVRSEWAAAEPKIRTARDEVGQYQDEYWARRMANRPAFDISKMTLREIAAHHRLDQGEIQQLVETGLRRWGDEFATTLLELQRERSPKIIRSNLVRALDSLPEHTLRPLMMEWLESADYEEWDYGVRLLGRIGQLQDLELVRMHWPRAWADRDPGGWSGVYWLTKALGRICVGEVHPQLVQAYEESEHSCARANAAAAMGRTSPEFLSRYAEELLWDCEADAREEALRRLSGDKPALLDRAREIAADPAEEQQVRQAAAALVG